MDRVIINNSQTDINEIVKQIADRIWDEVSCDYKSVVVIRPDTRACVIIMEEGDYDDIDERYEGDFHKALAMGELLGFSTYELSLDNDPDIEVASIIDAWDSDF